MIMMVILTIMDTSAALSLANTKAEYAYKNHAKVVVVL